MLNYNKVEVSNDTILYIMVGVSGSGKSTKAKELLGDGIIHSTDTVIEELYGDYNKVFEEIKETGNQSKLSKAHNKNVSNFKESFLNGVSPIIIDNTNLSPNQCKKYVKFALDNGISDENIKFIHVDVNDLTIDDLVSRNNHGLTSEKIQKMLNKYNGNKPLTIKKVMESKDKKRIKWAFVKLGEKSKDKLYKATKHYIPKEWKVYCHHMTIDFGKGLPTDMKGDLNKPKNLVATHIGISDMVVAVKVSGCESSNKVAHVTLGVNPEGQPKMSNDIVNWKPLTSNINLSGIIGEITY